MAKCICHWQCGLVACGCHTIECPLSSVAKKLALAAKADSETPIRVTVAETPIRVTAAETPIRVTAAEALPSPVTEPPTLSKALRAQFEADVTERRRQLDTIIERMETTQTPGIALVPFFPEDIYGLVSAVLRSQDIKQLNDIQKHYVLTFPIAKK
jgi:hypothetical protein